MRPPFGRLRKINDQSSNLVAEYRYNGLGFLISEHADTDDDGDVDGSDRWFHNVYDERWRHVATFREDDSDPKEEYVHHQAGLGGRGGSSYINSVVIRDRDANTAWTSASDGTLEERMFTFQNWRGDLVGMMNAGRYFIERVKYSAYGEPFGLPGGDTDSDGDVDATDVTQVQTWINAAAYDVRADVDLDGDVDATDKSTIPMRRKMPNVKIRVNAIVMGWPALLFLAALCPTASAQALTNEALSCAFGFYADQPEYEEGMLAALPASASSSTNAAGTLIIKRKAAPGPIDENGYLKAVVVAATTFPNGKPPTITIYDEAAAGLVPVRDPDTGKVSFMESAALVNYRALHPGLPFMAGAKAFAGSYAACTSMASALFHESLHEKLGKNGQQPDDEDGTLSCSHIAVYHTSVAKDCAKVKSLQACLDAEDSGDPEQSWPEDFEDCPEKETKDDGELESDDEYRDRIKDGIAGLCGAIAESLSTTGTPENEQRAQCCFCDPPPSNAACASVEKWTNPCEGVISTPFPAVGDCDEGEPAISCDAMPCAQGG